MWAVFGSGHSGNTDVHRLCNLRHFLCGADWRFDGSLFVYSLCGGILGMLHRSTAEPDDRPVESIALYFGLSGGAVYPKVVGNSVGLSSFWVLVAVLVGQNLFGVFGMILFIPLTSVVYTLLKNDTNRKLKKKAELAQETVGTDSEPHQTE